MRRRHCGCGSRKPICCPPTVHPTQVAPARVSPTQEVIKTNIFNTVVPHYHPVHTRTINRHYTHHQHYFPQTQSVENEYIDTQHNCGDPRNPNPGCFPRRRFGF
ncbi:spore coat protein D [Ureibacillus xyleni]|uniref:Spore coat protein D n=1 Tax=Ureibacillus xyleni TaxID=614648 RepID=A0A285SE33_9BACL|nr:CotD family spore coat protein [Ureibacillus xyleni]SOC06125.1 spore coat protein D [Ureibacillus xyleni]